MLSFPVWLNPIRRHSATSILSNTSMICHADSCREYQYTIHSRGRDKKRADYDAISRGQRNYEDNENHSSTKANKSKHSKTAWGKVIPYTCIKCLQI